MNPFNDPNYQDFQNIAKFLADLARSVLDGDMNLTEFGQLVSAIADQEDSDNRVDITTPYRIALYARGADDLADCLTLVELIIVGQNMAVGLKGTEKGKGDFDPNNLTDVDQEHMMHALRAVLRAHGMEVDIVDGGLRSKVRSDPWAEAVSGFRDELDTLDDPMSKWYRKDEG